MNRKKGFTLIELLAVIVLLGILALISVPVVKNITNDAKQKGFEQQKSIVLKGAKNWAIKHTDLLPEDSSSILVKMDTLKKEGFLENRVITNPVNKSEMNGCVEISYDANFNQYEYEYNDECVLFEGLLSHLATTSKELEITSVDDCATSETKCEAGTAFAIKVNSEETYKFYVLRDDGNTVTLIMSENLGNTVAWYADATDNSYGPITAINYLDELTADGWSNIPTKTYTYSGIGHNGEARIYTDITRTMRARMLTYQEAIDLNCTSSNDGDNNCPKWMYENLAASSANDSLAVGYWTSTAGDILSEAALFISDYGYPSGSVVTNDTGHGLRPVITVSKTTNIN